MDAIGMKFRNRENYFILVLLKSYSCSLKCRFPKDLRIIYYIVIL